MIKKQSVFHHTVTSHNAAEYHQALKGKSNFYSTMNVPVLLLIIVQVHTIKLFNFEFAALRDATLLRSALDGVLKHSNLNFLLPLLCYSSADWST